MWGYAITPFVALALLAAASQLRAETQSVIDPAQAPTPPKVPSMAPKKSAQPSPAVLRERERAAAERRKRAEAEARAQAAMNEAARLRAAEHARNANEAVKAKAAAIRQAAAAKTRVDETERRKREAAEARAHAAEKETAKLRAAEQARVEQETSRLAAEKEATAARIEVVEAERRKREAAEARAQAAEREVEKLRSAEQERRMAEQERRAADPRREGFIQVKAEWSQRLAVLERLRGQLTLSRALAILLDVNQRDEFAMLLELEASLKSDPVNSAYALSVNPTGQLASGRGWRSRTPELAAATAVTFCSKGGGESCRSVMLNGQFQENGFLEVARQFGKLNVVDVRGRYLRALRSTREISPWTYQAYEASPLSRLER